MAREKIIQILAIPETENRNAQLIVLTNLGAMWCQNYFDAGAWEPIDGPFANGDDDENNEPAAAEKAD
jgi:hypothetical protein